MSIESAIKAIHAAGLSDTQSEQFLSNDHLRRIVEVVLSEQWEPIETAPKNNGAKVLTSYKGVDLQVNTFTNHDDTAPGYRIGRDKTWWNSAPDRQPTHWMNIPKPPETKV